jgi:3-oxoacyl-[acyl-carrier protein] reductase
MDLGLVDKIALVTGGSGGIGAAVARCLAREGARVAIGYHGGREAADRLASDIERSRGTALVVQHDLREPDSIRAAVHAVAEAWGGPEVLVTCAWVHPGWPAQQPPVDPSPPDVWQQQLRGNVEGTARSVDAVLPHMKERGWGRIVLLSSGAAEDGQPGLEAYAGAKAALHGFARSLAQGLGPLNILTNVVMPGFIATERNRRVVPPGVLEHWASLTPTRRLATEDEVARVATFLASPANGSVTGAAIRVSGGH